MKNKFIVLLSLSLFLLISACSKKELDLSDPVSPTISSINTESGIFPFALGMWGKIGGGDYIVAANYHSIMGDECFIPWGNYGWRWGSQVYKITLPDGTVIDNPIGPEQKIQLQGTNSREAASLNAFYYEWQAMYYTIAECNILLADSKEPSFTFSGDADTKQKVLQAFGYWWRGWAYSRIGSMYIAGLVNNFSGSSSFVENNFVSNADIIKEANANLDSAATVLASISLNDTYTQMMDGSSNISIVPSFCNQNGLMTPDNWKRLCWSMKARNLLVNTKTKDANDGFWNQVASLASQGLQEGDVSFTLGYTSDATNDISGGFWNSNLMLSDAFGWLFPSERLLQEYQPGDQRKERNFAIYDGGINIMNPRGRGIQYGTTWYSIDAENGGEYSSADFSVNVAQYLAPSYEENELMLAEAKINTGSIDEGLAHVDNARAAQSAGLDPVSGAGLSADEAKEQVRSERRVGLFLRGLSFYDARRWNVIASVSQGGGRANANVLVPDGYGDFEPLADPAVLPCFMEYNYMDYWDVPLNELDFNKPSATSVPVKQ